MTRRQWFRLAAGLSLGLMLIILVGPFLIPVPPLQDTVPPEYLADADSLFIEIDGLTVHYKMQGEGEPTILLLHGFAASTFSWRKVMEPLAEIGTVVAYDRPGFGLTERPLPEQQDRNPYTADAQLDLAIGLIDALKIDRAVWVGNSAGGNLAVRVALAHPERVEGLVLVDAAIYETGKANRLLRPLLHTPQMHHLGPLLARRIRVWGVDFARSAWHDPSLLTPEDWEGYLKPLDTHNWDEALWEITRAGRPSIASERLTSLRVPILVISGDDDQIVPLEQGIRLNQELPNSELEIIAHCGHIPQEECPERFLEALRPFLLEVEARPD